MGKKPGGIEVGLKYADIKIEFSLHLKILKVIENWFIRIGYLGCLPYSGREPSIF